MATTSASAATVGGLLLRVYEHPACLSDTVFTARRYASTAYAVIVCLSVRLSVTSRHCTKTAKRTIAQTTLYDSPGILVF